MYDNSYLGSPEKDFVSRPIYSRKGRSSINDSTIDKVKQLFDFLETIESKADSFKSTHTFIENEMKSIESKEKEVIESYSEGRSKLLSLKIELEEANSLIQTLKKTIEKEKAKNIEIEETWRKKMDEKLQEQRKELEDVIKKHLDFIDQLVNDKKELGEQCEELIERLKDNEAKNAKQISDLKEKFQRESKNNKEIWMANEKQKREKWIKEKTNEIKEITIKGLEPEIDRIMNKGKEDVKKVEDKYRGEISKLKEELHWEYEEKLKQYKEKSLRESDDKIEKERMYMDQKMKEQYEKMEKRIAEEREKIKDAYEKKIEEQEKEKNKVILQLKEKIRKMGEDKK